MRPFCKLDLDVNAPNKVAGVLRAAAEAYSVSSAEPATAWQDDRNPMIWASIAGCLDTAAGMVEMRLKRLLAMPAARLQRRKKCRTAPSAAVEGACGVGAFRSEGTTPMQHDTDLEFHGSVNLMTPISDAARAWMDEHISEDALWHGVSVVVEPRYAPAFVQGMIADGLAVFSGNVRIVSVNS